MTEQPHSDDPETTRSPQVHDHEPEPVAAAPDEVAHADVAHDDDVPPPPPLDDATAPRASQPPAGTPAGWFPDPDGTRPDIVRYWDGAAWTDRWMQAEAAKATYGEKYRRRLPLTVLAVIGLNALTALVRLTQPALVALTTTIVVVMGIAFAVAFFPAGALWNLVVAAFPGSPTTAPRKPWFARPWTWAVVAALVVGPVVSYSLLRPATIPTVTISSPAEGCTEFLAVNLDAAQHKTTVLGMKSYYQALADAARTNAPALAADAQTVVDDPTKATVQSATSSIIQRCISDGDLTRDQVLAWVDQLKAADAAAK